jgi:hypothetical protein
VEGNGYHDYPTVPLIGYLAASTEVGRYSCSRELHYTRSQKAFNIPYSEEPFQPSGWYHPHPASIIPSALFISFPLVPQRLSYCLAYCYRWTRDILLEPLLVGSPSKKFERDGTASLSNSDQKQTRFHSLSHLTTFPIQCLVWKSLSWRCFLPAEWVAIQFSSEVGMVMGAVSSR